MSKRIPVTILDDDDDDDEEDELQVTGVAVCASTRTNLDPGCSKGVSKSSRQTGNSFTGNSNVAQQGVATGQIDGIAHPIPPNTTEWLQPSMLMKRSAYGSPPLSSPNSALLALGNVGEKIEAASQHPDNALAESPASLGLETRMKHSSSDPLFTKQFFMEMADIIAHIFPYGELARKHKCSVDQVNRALITVVLDPLMNGNRRDSYGDGNEDEGKGQISVGEEEGGRNLLINKWNKQYQAMGCELQRESEGEGLPMEFEQILVAASGNAEAYCKERNTAFDACKAFQDARKDDRADEGTAVRDEKYKSLQQQLEEIVEAAAQDRSLLESETMNAAAIQMQEKVVKEDGSTTSSCKRARSSSETVEGKGVGGSDSSVSEAPSPSIETSPALYERSSPPLSKKAKTTAYPSTPTPTSTRESITQTPMLYHPNPKLPVTTDGSSDTYKLYNLFDVWNNNTGNHPTLSPSQSASTSSFGPPSPTTQTPTPLPRSESLPKTANPIIIHSINKSHFRSSPPQSYFTRSIRRYPVTIDQFGNYQHEKQTQIKHQCFSSTSPTNNNKNTILLPRPNCLLRRRARNEREATDSGDECDFHDPYDHAGVDRTTRIFTGGLWGELFGGFGMGMGRVGKKARELVGLEFGLEQIEVSGKGKGKGRMIGDYGGDVNGKGAREGENNEVDADSMGLNGGYGSE